MSRRLTALFLALCMVFSMICTSAWADEEAADGAGSDAPGSVEAVEEEPAPEEEPEEPESAPSEESDATEEASSEAEEKEPEASAPEAEASSDESDRAVEEAGEPVEEEPEEDSEEAGPEAENEAPENTPSAEEEENVTTQVAKGACGKKVTWTLDDEGTLTISGTGPMYDWDGSEYVAPWSFYYVSSVKIENGVTTIGAYAFYSCLSLNSVTIPSSVTTIKDAAFLYCMTLNSVTFSNGLTRIGDAAFSGCQLTSVSLPDSLTDIGNVAFLYCTKVTSVSLPAELVNIGSGAFSYCSNIASVRIPNHVNTIGEMAFYACDGMNYAIIPRSVQTIEQKAFGRSGDNMVKPTIYGWSDSAAQTYADSENAPFVTALENPALTVSDQIYNGKALTPTVRVTQKGKKLKQDFDYTVSYENNYNAGTATAIVTGTGEKYGEQASSYTVQFQIRKANQSLTVNEIGTMEAGSSKSLAVKGNRTALRYQSSNSSVAAVSSSGVVTGMAPGSATITVSTAGNNNYNAASASVTVVVIDTNKITVSNVKKTMSMKPQSFSLKAKALGGAKLSYKSNNKSVKVNKDGKVTIAKEFCGTAKITVTADALQYYKKTSKSVTVTVAPGKAQVSVTSPKAKSIVITWKELIPCITGVEIQLHQNDGKLNALARKGKIMVKNTMKKDDRKVNILRSTSGASYTVKVRTYKKVGKKTYYGTWVTKKIKVR